MANCYMLTMKHIMIHIIRYLPTMGVVLMLFHLLACAAGIELCVSEIIVASILLVLLWAMSKVFGFCRLHRYMLLYTYIIYIACCSDYDECDKLQILRYIAIFIGVILLSWLVIKRKTCK